MARTPDDGDDRQRLSHLTDLEAMSWRQLESMLDAQSAMREVAEEMAREAREEVERLAIEVCPGKVDEYVIRSPEGLDVLNIHELVQLVVDAIKETKKSYDKRIRRLKTIDPDEVRDMRLELRELRRNNEWLEEQALGFHRQLKGTAGEDDKQQFATAMELRKDLERANAKIEQLQSDNDQLREEVAHLRSELKNSEQDNGDQEPPSRPARRQPASHQSPPRSSGAPGRRSGKPPWRLAKARPAPAQPAVAFNLWSNWAQKWRAAPGNFERDCDVILVAGGTGLAWRMDIAEQLGQWWDVTPRSGGVRRAFGRLKEHTLIDLIRPQRDISSWRPGYLVGLTDRGAEAYRFLRGEDPATSQLAELMRRHKTLEHVALNLKMAEVLWQAGYGIEIFPDVVPVGDGKVYYPDLKADFEGETIYVECERAIEGKKLQAMAKKLDLYREATNTGFYFATPTESDRGRLLTMLSEMEKHGAVPLHTTSIEYLEAEDYEITGENVWIT